jgi:hypothetical protein
MAVCLNTGTAQQGTLLSGVNYTENWPCFVSFNWLSDYFLFYLRILLTAEVTVGSNDMKKNDHAWRVM